MRSVRVTLLLLGVVALAAAAAAAQDSLAGGKLLEAISANDTAAVERLVDSGANVDPASSAGKVPLVEAVRMRNKLMLRKLLERCPDTNLRDPDGWSAYLLAQNLDDADLLSTIQEGKGRCEGCERDNIVFTDQDGTTRLVFLGSGNVGAVEERACSTSGYATWRCHSDRRWREWKYCNQQSELSSDQEVTNEPVTVKKVTNEPITVEKVRNTIRQLDNMEDKLKQSLEEAVTTDEKRTVAETYLNETLEVTSELTSEMWVEVDVETRAEASTRLQESVTTTTLVVASLLTNDTVDYTSESTSTRISRQSPSYYTPETRQYQHHQFPDTSIQLPDSFYHNYTDDEGMVTLVFYSYESLHCVTNSVPCNTNEIDASDLPTKPQVNSAVIGATVGGSTWRAAPGPGAAGQVHVKLGHLLRGGDLGEAKCVWWDVSRGEWSGKGCARLSHTDSYTICACDHLTNLAVIMDIRGVLGGVLKEVMRWWTIVGCTLSLVFLLLCVVCLCLAVRPSWSSERHCINTIYLHLCVCLGAAELVMMAGLDATHDALGCTVVAALLHYLFLATFTWCAIEGVNLYLMLGKVFPRCNPSKYYVCFGYGFPLVFVAITLGATQTKGYGTRKACWLEPEGLIWTFAGPLVVILTMNLVSFVFALRVACRRRQVGESQRRSPVKLSGSIALFLILGLTWVTGFTYMTEGTQVLALLFTALNSLQGVAMFVVIVCMNDRVRHVVTSLDVFRRLHKTVRKQPPPDDHQPNQYDVEFTVSSSPTEH